MQIFVDADACPVVGIVEKVAKEHSVPVTLLCDTNHVLSSDYSEVIVVGAGADAVDYKLINILIGIPFPGLMNRIRIFSKCHCRHSIIL